MNILLISHVLDYSGAPIALLQLARSLKRLKHSVSITSLYDGPLGIDFIKAGVKPYTSSDPENHYDLIIANTVVTVPAAIKFSGPNTKLCSWIHETDYFFKSIGIPHEKFMLSELRFAFFVANFQIDQFHKWMPQANKFQLKNCVEISYDIIPFYNPTPYLVCSGPWTERKSQHRLIELLQTIEECPQIHFIGAVQPTTVTNDKFIFTGPVKHEEALSRIAGSQGIISCSIDEAQPLIAIEAALMKVPVMLSDIYAHQELKGHMPDILLFDAANPSSFQTALNALAHQFSDKRLLENLRSDAVKAFNAHEFDNNIMGLLEQLNSI
jgi:glycosyltransferase involved in cell wall biosynthesis